MSGNAITVRGVVSPDGIEVAEGTRLQIKSVLAWPGWLGLILMVISALSILAAIIYFLIIYPDTYYSELNIEDAALRGDRKVALEAIALLGGLGIATNLLGTTLFIFGRSHIGDHAFEETTVREVA